MKNLQSFRSAKMQKHPTPMELSVFGAADGTRTRTVSLPGDFKSPVSTDSTTTAGFAYLSTLFPGRQALQLVQVQCVGT